jgi:lipopolysaccharide export system protein LptA
VVVTKGTIVIRGARMVVHQDPEGYQSGTVTADTGKKAFFREKREGADEFIEGESDTIEYDGKADLVKFIGRAEMRRLRGTTLSDETSGSVITYDNNSDQFVVEGGTAASPSNPGGRVRATLAPHGNAAAPAAAGASAPRAAPAAAAPASAASAARLRSTTTLGPESR